MPYFIDLSAYAGGHVSLPRDEKALVNEVGTESIVRDGQWSLIPGGAHLENLKKGDIIFSASQTEDLLKRGATPGHARAELQDRFLLRMLLMRTELLLQQQVRSLQENQHRLFRMQLFLQYSLL